MIGLYGMPGVGQTTLAQEVGKHAGERKLFDKVVMFTMSQKPKINNIQDKVADVFGLKFQTSSREGRAKELFKSMQRMNKILVIVDDLWEEFELKSIGIPFGDDHKGCKILLTTRHQQFCTKMNCQKEIQLGILSEDDAWVLFRDKAGIKDDGSSLNYVAKEVAAQCKGLPLAIVVVAKALKGESLDLDGWRAVNQRFKDSRHLDNEEVLGDVLKPLKLSYDYLKKSNNQMMENDIHMCFLLCSFFPEDDEISIELLIMCGIGVGLNKIGMALKKLQKSGLLLESEDAKTMRMHDVIRDFAHWLTSTGENRFMVKDELKEWPDIDGCYTAIPLWNCRRYVKNFPHKVKLPKLKTSFLGGDWKGYDLLEVSSTFFEEMKSLQVLYLERVSFSPKGSHSLPNLKTLCCIDCKMENFSSTLSHMGSLQILALIDTKIDEISEELVHCSTLKYLRLQHNVLEKEMKIPPKLVSSNINLLELDSLSRLTALLRDLFTYQIPPKYFMFPKLQRYVIVVGDHMGYHKEKTLRTLTIESLSSSLSAFNNLFCNLEKLGLYNISGLKNIVPSIDKMRVNELTSLHLKLCTDMEFLVDITRDQRQTDVFSNLVELKIEIMFSLKGLYCGLSPSHRAISSLTRLKIVRIRSCHRLKTIFSPCLAQSMLCIQELYIKSCDGQEQVIGFAREEEMSKNDYHLYCWSTLKSLHIQSCKSLKHVCANLSTQGFQSLESLYISDCHQLTQIFNMEQNEYGQDIVLPELRLQKYCWPNLRTLRIKNCLIFSCFIVQAQFMEELSLINVENSCQLCKTGFLVLNEDCIVVGNHKEVFQVRYIFSPAMAHSLSHLVDLCIEWCEEIERLILAKNQVSSSSSSNGDTGLGPINFPNLTKFTITDCENLKSLFPFGSIPVLPKLESFMVERNSKLEQIFELEDETKVAAKKEMQFDKLESLSLEDLPGLIHFCPKGYHFVLSALRELGVRYCPNLTTGFFIDSQEFVHCKTKTPQLIEQVAIEEFATVSNAIFSKNIFWSRGFDGSQLPPIT
ncbi:hypothetical protein V6Z12_A04G025000 [Gossypium hirsutum]